MEPDVRQTILPEQPFKVFRHEVGPEQFAFLIGADEVQIIGAVAFAEQLAVKLLLFLLLEQFGFHSLDQRQGAAAGLVLHHVADDRDVLSVHPLFCDFVVDGHGLPLKVDRRPFQPQNLTAAQTVVGRDEDAQVERVILRHFKQLLDLVLGVEVGPEAVLLGPVYFQHRVDFQIVLAHSILERLAEDGVIVDDRVGGATIQQDLLLKLVQHLRCDLAELQTQWLEVLCDAALNHLIVADEGGGLDGCLVNLNPLVEIIQKQHLRLAGRSDRRRDRLGCPGVYFFVSTAPACGQFARFVIPEQDFVEHGFGLALVAAHGQTSGNPLDLPLAVGIVKVEYEIETSIFLLDRPCCFHHKPPCGLTGVLSVAAITAYHIQRRISSRKRTLPGEQELDDAQLRNTVSAPDPQRKQAAGANQLPYRVAVQVEHLGCLLQAEGIGVAGKHLGIGIVKLHRRSFGISSLRSESVSPAVISFAAKRRSGDNVKRTGSNSSSPIADGFKPVCVNKLRSPILVLDFPRSGESSGGGLAPHHWHFSHPVFVMTGLRVTEVPFVKYRTIELFCFQRTEFYRKSSEFKASEKLSLYLRAIENGPKVA